MRRATSRISPAAAGCSRSFAEGWQGPQILAAVKRGLELPASECPEPTPRRDLPRGHRPLGRSAAGAAQDALRGPGVAQKLVASADDLELIAADDGADGPGPAWLAARDLRRRRAGAEAWPAGADGGRPARQGGARHRGLSRETALSRSPRLRIRSPPSGRCARPSASRRRSTASPYMTPPFFGSTRVRRSPARRRLVSRNSAGWRRTGSRPAGGKPEDERLAEARLVDQAQHGFPGDGLERAGIARRDRGGGEDALAMLDAADRQAQDAGEGLLGAVVRMIAPGDVAEQAGGHGAADAPRALRRRKSGRVQSAELARWASKRAILSR